MSIERQLSGIADRLSRARRELAVAEEQLPFLTEVAEEARVQMLVAETPLAGREYREAAEDLGRLLKHHRTLRGVVGELTQEQDRLLELLGERSAST